MKTLIQLILLGIGGLSLMACHTTAGLGQDIQEVGHEMQEASHDVHQ